MGPRPNHYFAIHKALRQALFTASLDVARTAFAVDDFGPVLRRLRWALQWLIAHGHHEDRYLHKALEARASGSTEAFAQDHRHLHTATSMVLALIDEIAAEPDDFSRVGLATQLHVRLNDLIGEYLVHMSREETHGMEQLWANFNDAELLGIVRDLQSSIPPLDLGEQLAVMFGEVNLTERASMVLSMQDAPEELAAAFEQALRDALGDDGLGRPAAGRRALTTST